MKKTMLLAGLMVVLVAGCDNKPAIQPMPEVNDTNCQIEAIKKIEDEAMRREFGGRCSRRPGAIAPTKNPKNWLELIDQTTPKDQGGEP